MDRRSSPGSKTRVVVLTNDADLEKSVRAAFAGHVQIEPSIVANGLRGDPEKFNLDNAAIIIADVDADYPEDFEALQRLAALGGRPPIIVVTRVFSEGIARQLLQYRIADFMVKPVAAADLVRACTQAVQGSGGPQVSEAQIHTFLPAAGGVGVTTLAIQTALLLLRGGPRAGSSTCLVDLDFQHGACADYLDIEPRLDLGEIEPRPERLDCHLLEVMLSHHSSGLAVVAAPHRPAEMRSFDADIVTRLLDLVSARFDHVVIDMPRTWFAWTDSVLVGSNKLFVVTQATVPGLRHAKHLITAINERLGDAVDPRVIVNRFEQRWFGPGLRLADIKQALGHAFAGATPNNYPLVREAIDRGVPLDEVKSGNNVVVSLKKLITAHGVAKPARRPEAPAGKARGVSWAQ